jgi:maleylacetoacetate isomerase/maleylpyruvate isomerase
MQLYSYFRSSASYRVRIALELKGLAYEYMPIHLLRKDQLAPAYVEASSNGLVPMLVDGELRLHQSMAIIEYLDERHPEPPLLPRDPAGRARVRAIAQDIACEIHPLDNLRVLRWLVKEGGFDDARKDAWYRHWVEDGLATVERQLAAAPSRFCHGDVPTLADCLLVPQVFNAQRYECRLDGVPNVMRVHEACTALEPFRRAQPSACPDAE